MLKLSTSIELSSPPYLTQTTYREWISVSQTGVETVEDIEEYLNLVLFAAGYLGREVKVVLKGEE